MQLLPHSGMAEERAWLDRDAELELRSFYYQLDEGQPDWLGQRLLVRTQPRDALTTQLELTAVRRGASDWGGQAALALWADWTRNLFSVAHVSGSYSAEDFYPEWRADLELHGKIPEIEQWVIFGGGGRAKFSDADTWITTTGTTYYFAQPTVGNVSYRYTHFSTDFDAGSPRGSTGDSSAHLAQLTLGSEHGSLGQIDLRYLYGNDLLRDFVSLSGRDETFSSHNVYLGWRRQWAPRFGTHVQIEWGRQRELYDNRWGVEAGIVVYFGPQLDSGRRASQ